MVLLSLDLESIDIWLLGAALSHKSQLGVSLHHRVLVTALNLTVEVGQSLINSTSVLLCTPENINLALTSICTIHRTSVR